MLDISYINNVDDIEKLTKKIKSNHVDGKISVINLNWTCSFRFRSHFPGLDVRLEKATKSLLECCIIEKFVFRFENDSRGYIHFFRNTKFEFLNLKIKDIYHLDNKEKESISMILKKLKDFHLSISFDEKSKQKDMKTLETFKFHDFKPMLSSKNLKILRINVNKLPTLPKYIIIKLVKAAVVYTKAEVYINGLILVFFALELNETDKGRIKYDYINSLRDFYLVLKKYGCQIVNEESFFTIFDERYIFDVQNILSEAIRTRLKFSFFVFNRLTSTVKGKGMSRFRVHLFDVEIVDTYMQKLIKNLVQLPIKMLKL